MKTAKCKRCPARIVWAVSESTGRRMPVDADPSPNGNVQLVEGDPPRARVLSADERNTIAAQDEPLHLNHFVTCPEAGAFRNGGKHGTA